MSTFRFALVAAGLFALAFVGIFWGSKGFPVMAMLTEPMKPAAHVPAVTYRNNVAADHNPFANRNPVADLQLIARARNAALADMANINASLPKWDDRNWKGLNYRPSASTPGDNRRLHSVFSSAR
jgi:hypothetical protein